MIKTIVAGTVALTLAGAGLAVAQQMPRDAARWRPSTEDAAAFTDARIAALKAGLRLSADQEKSWPAVETALRDLAKQRTDRIRERAERLAAHRDAMRDGATAPRRDAYERLRRGADAMTVRAAGLRKLADAVEPLYKSLDDGQKRRFGMLLRMGGRAGHGAWRWQHRADNAR